MTIKKVGKVYWCSFYPAPGGPRVRQSLHTQDKAEALRMEAKLRMEYESKAKAKSVEGITLAEACAHAWRVRDEWRSAKRPDSIEASWRMVEAHLGGDCPLSALTDDVLLDWGEELHDSGLAASTINKRFGIIAVLFTEAIKWRRYHGSKPISIRYRVAGARQRLIAPQEEARVLQILRAGSPFEQAMADLVVVLADTGMRLGEALGLKPENISHEHRAVLICKTKNNEDRAVPLTARAYAVLQARAKCSPVFHPLVASSVSHIWRRVRTKMGLADEPEFVLHAFRHTFGSTLANAGTDSFRLQKVMGHRSIVTTQGYIKVAMGALAGLSDIMEKRTQNMPTESAQEPPQSRADRPTFGGLTLGEILEETKGYPIPERTVNPQVPGSSPGRGAKQIKG